MTPADHEHDVDVDVHDVAARHERGEIQLVDIRESYEFEQGRIAGAAHIPLAALPAGADQLDHARPVVFYCRVGGRSAYAAQAFRRAGYSAWSMAGGLLQWQAAGLALVPEDGRVADH